MADVVYKLFNVTSKALDETSGTYEVLVSSELSDRDNDILLSAGAKLSNFQKNPVVLYAHDYGGLPVAKATSIEAVQGTGLKAVMQFPTKGISARADEVHGLWAAGFLNAASVGFIPRSYEDRTTDTGVKSGRIFTDWELLEFSIVPVPANAAALRLSIEGAIETKKGRVLSASNEQRLRGAANMILEVLDQVATPQPEDEPIEESLNETDVKGLADVLAELNNVMRGV